MSTLRGPDPGTNPVTPTRIYLQEAATELPRAQQVLERFPEAVVIPVRNHWRIPELHGDERLVQRWVRIKQEALVVGVLGRPEVRSNGRSADFIAPSLSNGCGMACVYCYVPRRKGYSNPITVFANIEQIVARLDRHVRQQSSKPQPNQCDPAYWVYDIGENSDCSVDALISENPKDVVTHLRDSGTAIASFATKFVNEDMLAWDPQRRARIRFSLMPSNLARVVDLRTAPMERRIGAIAPFVEAGWQVHVNLSPIIWTPTWQHDWRELLRELADTISPAARAQLAAEVITLTHNEHLHRVNQQWHPKAEALLWRQDMLEPKTSQNGQRNVRYRAPLKRQMLADLGQIVAETAPWLRIRYAF